MASDVKWVSCWTWPHNANIGNVFRSFSRCNCKRHTDFLLFLSRSFKKNKLTICLATQHLRQLRNCAFLGEVILCSHSSPSPTNAAFLQDVNCHLKSRHHHPLPITSMLTVAMRTNKVPLFEHEEKTLQGDEFDSRDIYAHYRFETGFHS